MKRPRDRAAICFIVNSETGIVITATRARCHEIHSIIASVPTIVSRPVRSWLNDCCRLWDTLSMSLVTRDSRSPRACSSTYGRGNRWSFSSTSDRSRNMVRCTTPASRNACAYPSTYDATYRPMASHSVRCSAPTSMPCPLRSPSKMTSVACPSTRGPATTRATLATASTSTTTTLACSGAEEPQESARRRAEVLRLLGRGRRSCSSARRATPLSTAVVRAQWRPGVVVCLLGVVGPGTGCEGRRSCR